MLTFTTQSPVSAATFAGIMVGGSTSGETRGTTVTDIDSSSASSTGSTVNYGLASGATSGGTTNIEFSSIGIRASFSGIMSESKSSGYTPPTVSSHIPAFGTTLSYDTTYTLAATTSESSTQSSSRDAKTISGNTFEGRSTGISTQNGYTSGSTYDGNTSSTVITGSQSNTITPSGTVASSTANSGSVSSSTFYRSTNTYGSKTVTYGSNDDGCPRYTTTSETFETTVGTVTTTSSYWNTEITTANHDFTAVSVETNSSGKLTVEGDGTSSPTESYTFGTGDSGIRDQSFPKTDSNHCMLADTVYRLSDGDSGFLLGYMLWSIPSAGPDTTTAKFTDLYSASVGNSFTISDYQKFTTDSLAIPVVTISRATVVSTTGTGTATGTVKGTVSLTNGFSASSTQGHTNNFVLGAIGQSVSTATNSSGVGSTTVFTCEDFVSGYATSGARAFTVGTTTRQWQATSVTGTHDAWASSYSTTGTKASRVVTEDAVLRNVNVTTGTTTRTSFVGLSRFTTSRIIDRKITVTSTNWHVGLSASNWASSYTTDSSEPGFLASYSTTVFGGHGYSSSSSRRMAAAVSYGSENPPGDNAAWMTAPARGWAGFCGSFTQTSPAIYLTTATGLAAGAVFPDAYEALVFTTREMQEGNGVRIVPVNSRVGISLNGVGMASSSLISAPASLVTAVSVAATWTSTIASGTTTGVTSKSATHTAAVQTQITGDFWASYGITIESGNANIGYNSPHASRGGYVAGDNRMGSHEVRLMAGAVSWTRFTAGASSDTGASGETSGTNESVSFIVPQGAAIRIAMEPILTIQWLPTATNFYGDHAIPAHPHQDFDT